MRLSNTAGRLPSAPAPPFLSACRGRAYPAGMAEFDVDAFIQRYRDRAAAVKERGLPPVAGEERMLFIQQAEQDYLDFSLVGTAEWAVEDDKLVLRIPLAGD